MSQTPLVSIVLPTLNGAEHLRRLLPALAAQEVPADWGGFELCAIDSTSDDESRELLEGAGASVQVIPRADFRHGAARNLAAEKARGEFLVFLSQDASPRDVLFLSNLIASFDDPRVAGAYARILPSPDEDPLTARTALDQPEASAAPRVRDLDDVGVLRDVALEELPDLHRFNNVASAIRTSVFRKLPFPDVDFGEDTAWATRALGAGWRIRFAPEAAVYHAHRYSPAEAFRRYKVDARFHLEQYGRRVRPSLVSALRGWAYEMKRDYWFVRWREFEERWPLYLRSPLLRGAQVLGQYFGSR
jgi:rhamnosyltransferase